MPSFPRPHLARAACLLALTFWTAPAAAALEPDQIALVVNAKVPAGVELAEFYAQARHIPAGRIIALDLPEGEEMPFDRYDRDVVPAVRTFLKRNALEDKVTCLVTFYGLPLRVGRRAATPVEKEELRAIDAEFAAALEQARAAVGATEALAREANPDFKPDAKDDPPALIGRAEAASAAAVKALGEDADPSQRAARFTRLLAPLQTLYGPLETTQRLSRPPYSELVTEPLNRQRLDEHEARARKVLGKLNALLPQAGDAKARERIRAVAKENLGAIGYLQALAGQKNGLRSDETESAFDSELALLWWPDGYARHRWQVNPLYYKVKYATPGAPRPGGSPPRTLMVTRLDAPTDQLVRELIAASIKTEAEGLKGVAALDARGKPPSDAYGRYDQTIRNLADLLRQKSSLDVVLDDKEPVFAEHAVKDVALYCGWYSLRKYVPGMRFNPGAVGFHIASAELVSLHRPNETGWVHNLVNDGVAASLGPVAEPYLHSFPAADEFFPLLLTGKLTLAQVYWRSNPLASWMNTCIGDPLYTPYKTNPALKPEDLPAGLHVVFE